MSGNHPQIFNYLTFNSLHAFVVVYLLFSKLTFSKSFRNTIKVLNGSDSDQDRHSVGPDLGSNCLPRLSEDDKSRH